MLPKLWDFLKKMYKINQEKKKHEYKGEVEVAGYDIIQEEEDNTRRIGRLQDKYELEYMKQHQDDDDEEEEDDYHNNEYLIC